MPSLRYFLVALGVLVLIVLGAKLAAAQPQPTQGPTQGGGAITGYVLGFNMYDQLEPVEWATVWADNGQMRFVAYSSSGGYYEMFVPPGTYNVTVTEPGYNAYSNVIAVSPGSTSTINFYLNQSHVPVPEFPAGVMQALAVVTLSGALIAMRRAKRRKR